MFFHVVLMGLILTEPAVVVSQVILVTFEAKKNPDSHAYIGIIVGGQADEMRQEE